MTDASPPVVRFGRLERRGVILGLTGGQVAALAAAVAVVSGAVFGAGARGLVVTAPVWVLLTLIGMGRAGGRPLVAWVPLLTAWTIRGLAGGTSWRTGPEAQRAAAALRLPGLRARVTLRELSDGTAVVQERGVSTVVVEVAGLGFALSEPAVQQRMVSGWGRVLAWVCQQPDVLRVQVMHRTGSGGAAGVRRWWAEHGTRDGSWASRLVADLLAGAAADRQECFIALAVRRCSVVPDLMAACTDALVAADLDVLGWMTRSRLERVVRAAYDPAGAQVLDVEAGDAAGSGVAAMGVEEEWDRLQSDSAWHATYWVSEWPRSDVPAGFLQPLLLMPGGQGCFSVVAEPLPLAEAMREIRRAKADHIADSAQRARIGQVEDEAMRAEAADVLRREQELVAGHGDLRFVGLVCVSARTAEELDGACAALEAAAARSMCEVRRLVGQQMLAHASACLPLARRVT